MIMVVMVSVTYGVANAVTEVIAEVKAHEKTNNNDGMFVQELKANATSMTWENLVQKLKQGKVYGEDLAAGLEEDDNENINGENAGGYELKIFVSHSMPIQLLRSYATEATTYGGTLIFKGLPGGSFKELQQLVTKITNDEEEHPSIQIDDEAFEHYSVTDVPAIVLVKSNLWNSDEQSRLQFFDKISGNVGLKYALDKFKDAGDLKLLAAELLAK